MVRAKVNTLRSGRGRTQPKGGDMPGARKATVFPGKSGVATASRVVPDKLLALYELHL